MRGFNDDEVVDFVDLTEKMVLDSIFPDFSYFSAFFQSIDVRFIEFMPFGGNDFDEQKMVPYRELLTKIFAKYGSQVLKLENEPNHTSKSYKIQSFKGQVLNKRTNLYINQTSKFSLDS
jgi:cyclic pyranopterin phosphate synthase